MLLGDLVAELVSPRSREREGARLEFLGSWFCFVLSFSDPSYGVISLCGFFVRTHTIILEAHFWSSPSRVFSVLGVRHFLCPLQFAVLLDFSLRVVLLWV